MFVASISDTGETGGVCEQHLHHETAGSPAA